MRQSSRNGWKLYLTNMQVYLAGDIQIKAVRIRESENQRTTEWAELKADVADIDMLWLQPI